MDCGDNYTFSLWVHIPVGSCIALLCLLGNLPLFWMYATAIKTLKDKLFEVSLAVVDVFACTFLLCSMTFIQGQVFVRSCSVNTVWISTGIFCLYLHILLDFSVSIVRFLAVYFLATYKTRKLQMTGSLVVASFLLGSVATSLGLTIRYIQGTITRTHMGVMVLLSLLILTNKVALYIAIISKLWKTRQKLGTSPAVQMFLLDRNGLTTARGGSIQHNSAHNQVKKREKHVLVMKMLVSNTLLFVVTTTASALVVVWSWNNYWMYIAFISYVKNPGIYIWLNQDFRKEYLNFWGGVSGWLRRVLRLDSNNIQQT